MSISINAKQKNDYSYHLQLKTQKTKAHKQKQAVSLRKEIANHFIEIVLTL